MVLGELCRLHLGKRVEFGYKGAVLKGTLLSVSHLETFTCFTVRDEKNEFRMEMGAEGVNGLLITVFE